jgi:hypothetical protein
LIKKEKEDMEEIHSYEQKVASNSGNSYIGRRSYRCIVYTSDIIIHGMAPKPRENAITNACSSKSEA